MTQNTIMSRWKRLVAGVLLLPAFFAVSAMAASAACLSDWSSAGALVQEHGLTPAGDLAGLARAHVEGDLVKVQLCEQAGQYVYKLTFFKADGTVVKMTVDARQPFQD